MEMPAPDQFTLSRKAEIVARLQMLSLMTLPKPKPTNVTHSLHIAARPWLLFSPIQLRRWQLR